MSAAALKARCVQVHKALATRFDRGLLRRCGPLCVRQMTVVVKLAASTVSEHLSDFARQYIAGVIILAAAPGTAMVFVR